MVVDNGKVGANGGEITAPWNNAGNFGDRKRVALRERRGSIIQVRDMKEGLIYVGIDSVYYPSEAANERWFDSSPIICFQVGRVEALRRYLHFPDVRIAYDEAGRRAEIGKAVELSEMFQRASKMRR